MIFRFDGKIYAWGSVFSLFTALSISFLHSMINPQLFKDWPPTISYSSAKPPTYYTFVGFTTLACVFSFHLFFVVLNLVV